MELKLNLFGLKVGAEYDRAEREAISIDRAARKMVAREIRDIQIAEHAQTVREANAARLAEIQAKADQLRADMQKGGKA